MTSLSCFRALYGWDGLSTLFDKCHIIQTRSHSITKAAITVNTDFKMNLSKPPMTIAGAACGAVSVVLGIAAIAVPKWLAFDLGIAEVSFGLWRACASVSVGGEVVCGSYEQTPGWIIATSAIEVAGICEILFAVLLAFLHIFIAKNSKVAGKVPGPSAVGGGVIMIVGAIIWAAKYKDEQLFVQCSLSVGFILAIVSGFLSIVAGILLLLGWKAESSEQPHSKF